MFLLDTNTVSIVRKNVSVQSHFQRTLPSDIFLSALVEAELRYGLIKQDLERSRVGVLIDLFISNCVVLPWSSATAKSYATLRARSESKGITISTIDLMIAAHAQEHNLTLVTNDQPLQKLRPWLRVVDWTVD